MMAARRLITLVLEVSDLAASVRFYRDHLGLPLHEGADNEAGDDRWISGEHAALSWHDGAFLHFSLYQAKSEVTRCAQVGFPTDDIEGDHARLIAAGVPVIHPPRAEPWGETARYADPDGNVVSLTQRSA
jgi:catechol 2,3-dioxygenase-like lactoylglutathione lyase family enzyme